MEELTGEGCARVLEEEDVAHIGVISDGEPYVTPLSYVIDGSEFLFRTGSGRRLDAIRENPRVCIEVTQYDPETGDWRSVVAWGTARVVDSPGERSETVEMLLRKYRHVMEDPLSFGARPPLAEPFIVTVELERITGRSSGAGLTPRSRPGRL
jgi:nitroimidazol reductase NimA-like FMN-containing flavoprotein (pyridoxamine 5'-phosphate oxidase superfamily)